MAVYAGENLAGQLPTDPELPPADPDPSVAAILPEERPERPGRADPYATGSMPIPQWSQPYMRSQGRKSPSEWGTPDYILEGARGYPGLAPSPWMPQPGDMRGLMQNVGMFFAGNGSIPNQLLSGQMLAYYDRFEKDRAAGLTARARLNLLESQVRQTRLAENMQRELQQFAETHAAYRDDPSRLRQAWLDLSYQFDDPVLRDAIQTKGLQRAEEVLSERHNNNLDALKVIHQRLQNEKLEQETRQADELEASLRAIHDPNAATPQTAGYLRSGTPDPSAIPRPNISSDPTVPLGTPAAGAVPGAEPAAPTAAAPTTPFPAGVTADNASARRGELTDWANRNARPIPPPDTAGLAKWVAANAPSTPAGNAPSATAGTSPLAATQPAADVARVNMEAPSRATRLAAIARMSEEELDRRAWDYYIYGRLPNTGSVPANIRNVSYLQNEAVKARAVGPGGLQEWTERLLRAIPPMPEANERASVARADQILNQLALQQPGLAGQLRQIIHGDTPLPQAGFGATARGPQVIRDLVARLDPSYGVARYTANNRTVLNFQGGQQAQRLGAFKTAIDHASTMMRIINQMPNTSVVPLNRFLNNIKTQLGDPTAVEFRSAFDLFSTEVARAFRGSQTTLTEIQHIRENLNINSSPAQMRAGIRVMAELMNGQLNSLADEYNRGRFKNIKGEDLFVDPEYAARFRSLRSLPFPASVATGFQSEGYYTRLGSETYDSAVPANVTKLNDWLAANPNDPYAAPLREKLRGLGWLGNDR